MKKASVEILLNEYNDIKEALDRDPTLDEYLEYSEYKWTFKSIFLTYRNFQRVAHIGIETILSDPATPTPETPSSTSKTVKKQDVINTFVQFYRDNGRIPYSYDIRKYFSSTIINKLFGGYCELLEALGKAGLPVEERIQEARIRSLGRTRTKEDFIKELRTYIQENGKEPTLQEFVNRVHCSTKTIRSWFGSFDDFLNAAYDKPIHIKKPVNEIVRVTYSKYPVKYKGIPIILKWARRRDNSVKVTL